MKLYIQFIVLLFNILLLSACNNASLQEQMNRKYGQYTEEIKPQDQEFYKAYNKTLELWSYNFV